MNQAPSRCGHRLPLSDEQLAVLECCLSGGLLVVVSKAGTGKTRTAAALSCLGLAVGQRILLLSFTRNGVKELARELALQHGLFLEWATESSLRGPRIAVRTFDSLLAWALSTIGVEEARRERAGLRWQMTELTLRIGKAELYHAGQDAGLWTPHNYHFRLRDICDLLARRQSLSDQAKAVVDRWWPALRENAERKRLILRADYDRLVIANAREIAVLLEQTCELVVVDEHQDSSDRDVAPLIEAARRGRLTQGHFGDPGQSAMGFRGALGDPCVAFRSAGCVPKMLALTENYRSSPEIVLASNSLQLAAGWKGPVAIHHPGSPHGPSALLATVGDDTMALDALMVLLAAAGLAMPDLASERRVPAELASELEARGKQLVRLCGERAALVEVICPTNSVAKALVAALEERGVEPAWVCSVANPYDSILATMLSAWFDEEGCALEQARLVLTAHINSWAAGSTLAAREELRACASVVLNALAALPRNTDRWKIAEDMSACMSKIAEHSNVSEDGRRYAGSARLLVESFPRVPYVSSAAEAIALLEQTLVLPKRPTTSRRTRQHSPSMLEALKTAGLRPLEVPNWLDEQARRWRLGGSDAPTSGVVVKTPEIAKGDTCDGVVVHHAELLPRPERRSRLTEGGQDEFARPAQAYIAISRPRFVYVGLAVGKLPSYHDVPLEGWTYLDVREKARGRLRPA
jgi:hypothetical protein